ANKLSLTAYLAQASLYCVISSRWRRIISTRLNRLIIGRRARLYRLIRVHLRANLLQTRVSSHLDASLLYLSHATFHRVRSQLSLAQGLGVATLNLIAHRVQGWTRGVGQVIHARQRVRDLFLHLGLLQLAEQLGTFRNLLTKRSGVALNGRLSLISLLQCLVVQTLRVFNCLLRSHDLRCKCLCGVFVFDSLVLIAVSASLIGQFKSLAGIALQLLNFAKAAVQLHLQLSLVTDNCCCLLGQFLVLTLCVLNCLLDLYLRVSVLLNFGV